MSAIPLEVIDGPENFSRPEEAWTLDRAILTRVAERIGSKEFYYEARIYVSDDGDFYRMRARMRTRMILEGIQ